MFTISSDSRSAGHTSDMVQLRSVHSDELQRQMDTGSFGQQTPALLAYDMPAATCLCNAGAPCNEVCNVMP